MTTEKYIENLNLDTKLLHYGDKYHIDKYVIWLIKNALYEAREDERKKAIKAFEMATVILDRSTLNLSMGELRAKFNELLNTEE